MRLFYAPGACSLAPHIAALEAGLAVDLEKVDLRTKKTASGSDYLAINPKGYVPALETDDGDTLTEASAILQYLGDRQPGELLPRGGRERYRVIEWLAFIATEIHKGFGPLWNPKAADEVKRQARERLAQRFAFVEQGLGARPYLTGEAFTVADAYLYTVLNWTGMTQVDLAPFPKLAAFRERVGARPKVREALRAEGLPG